MSYNTGTKIWSWTDGNSRMVEAYDWNYGVGKLLTQTDTSGNAISFVYTNNQLTEVRDQSGEKQMLVYDGKNLAEIHTLKQIGDMVTRVRYGYDQKDRLSTVTVDLSPEDNSIADGKSYVTTYTYDGDSKRVAGILESDGTQAAFTYKQIGAAWLIETMTQTVDAVSRKTTFGYGDILNAVPTIAPIDDSVLDTIGDQVKQMNLVVDSSKFTTSEVIVTGHSASIDNGALVTTDTSVANYTANVDSNTLLTTEDGITQNTAQLNAPVLSTTEPFVQDHVQNADPSKLSTTEVQGGISHAAIDSSKLSTSDPIIEHRAAGLTPGALSTTEIIVTPGSASLDSTVLKLTDTQTVTHLPQLDPAKLSASGTATQQWDLLVNAGELSTSGTGTVNNSASLDTAKLSTTDTQVVNNTANVIASALSTTDTTAVTSTASLITSKLSTTDTQTTAYTAALKTTAVLTTENQTATVSLTPIAGSLNTDTTNVSTTANRKTGITSYTVPPTPTSGPTGWAKFALDCYGDERGRDALRIAMGNPTLTVGKTFTNLPAKITFNVTKVSAPYYLVKSGDTWTTITKAIYGTTETNAINALKTALGNPALSANKKLTPIPSPLSFSRTTVVTVAPYYVVKTGDTWNSVTLALYGTTDVDAIAALKTALGNPALTVNSKLTKLPSPLAYSKTVTVTVAPYYRVVAGDSWASIAGNLYGASGPEAGAALATALGNPALSVGSKLVSLPAKLTYTVNTTVTVPSYYRVQNGDTWAGITMKLYGTDNAAAVNALTTALGTPALTAGAKLQNIPATLQYQTSATVTVPAYYTLQSGDTFATLALSLYGASATEAADALKTALGNPALVAGQRLTGLPSVLNYQTTVATTVAAYYLVQAADTWGTIAQRLYGSTLPAAAAALRDALGNPALTTGAKLTGIPATLSFTDTVAIIVPAYYTVGAGDSWSSISGALYGDAAAGASLQAALGNVALIEGSKLTGLPASLSYNVQVVVAVPPYFQVSEGDSWTSIAQALYGTNTQAAADALRTALGAPVLAAGVKLTGLPQSLTFSVNTTITVPAYYRIQAGDSWSSITAALFGTNDAEAATALQAMLGSPTLTAGVKLTNVAASLDYDVITGYKTVPAYYRIGAGDSWSSITQNLYGTSDIDAAQALQEAMGSPSLLAGAKLTSIPAQLDYQIHITVPAYYRVKSGDTWRTVAQAIYGVNAPEAGAALQQALAGQSLVVDGKLVGFPATLAYTTTTIAVPPYYRIQVGDTWASIVLTLYGRDEPEAAAALQTAMGNVALTPGAKLTSLPYSFQYTLQKIKVAPYFRIRNGETWGSLAASVYHTSAPAAASALQAAMGNPPLVVGQKLESFPATLSYTVTTVIAPYYLVKAGDSWESITSAVYRTTDAEAVQKLKSTLGNPVLSAGKKLSGLPQSLTYNTSATVILDSTYVVKAGDSWAAITLALYGSTETAAVEALKAALGNPALTVGAKLSPVPASLAFIVTATGVPVPPYYRIKAGDSWESITATLYHTNNEGAVAALRAALGDPVLTAGGQLDNLPASLNYAHTPSTGAETRVTDALGNVTIVTSDNRGRLTKVTGPQVNGVSESIRYTYDASGNLLS